MRVNRSPRRSLIIRALASLLLILAIVALPRVALAAPNVWFALPSLSRARQGHTATLLGDGRVLVVGGVLGSSAVYPIAELYSLHTVWLPLLLHR